MFCISIFIQALLLSSWSKALKLKCCAPVHLSPGTQIRHCNFQKKIYVLLSKRHLYEWIHPKVTPFMFIYIFIIIQAQAPAVSRVYSRLSILSLSLSLYEVPILRGGTSVRHTFMSSDLTFFINLHTLKSSELKYTHW